MAELFDDLADVYESLIDWPKRLANETPFYRRLLQETGATCVLDVACGTGHHAAMLHSWGLRVEGADISQKMVARARDTFGEPSGLRWVVRGFGDPIHTDQLFDLAFCVGNSLALVPDMESAERAIRRMLGAVRAGGVILVQVLNLWHLPDGPCVWQKFQRASLPQAECLIAKGVHRSGAGGFVDLLVMPLSEPSSAQIDSVRLLGLESPVLEAMAIRAGAERVILFGGYQSQPYQRGSSVDLILVAEKGITLSIRVGTSTTASMPGRS